MKTKFIILLGCLLLITMYVSGQNWNKISKDIKKKQLSMIASECKDINRYYELRKSSEFLKKMVIIPRNDTIFILQIHREIDASLYSKIWNKSDTLSVNLDDFGITTEITHEQTFTNYMMKLVSEWNFEEIKKEELKNGTLPSDIILATRIIFRNNQYKINCLYFKKFFNIERDRWK